jgi:NAD(P)-dependent dehydrogenase (short-subunit alcohol dehydrogenase family)
VVSSNQMVTVTAAILKKMLDTQSAFQLDQRVAVVTGGAGLLGSGFCRTLAEAGAAVVVADQDEEAASILANSLARDGLQAISVETDVTSPDSVGRMVESTVKVFSRLDILVNSAALDPKFDPLRSGEQPHTFEDYPLESWNQALDVNLTGTYLCCQAVARPMLAQGKGVIINLCSIYGLVGPDQRIYQQEGEVLQFKPPYYTVTKAGVLGLTLYLATYFAGKNIRVNALSPGGVYAGHDEAFVKAYSARTVLGRMAEKHEMNGALLFLASDASSYMTGANLVVDGGWSAW